MHCLSTPSVWARRPGEVNSSGCSSAPHFDLAAMMADACKRRAFQKAFADRGLGVIALHANGNPLHPTDPKRGKDYVPELASKAGRVASALVSRCGVGAA